MQKLNEIGSVKAGCSNWTLGTEEYITALTVKYNTLQITLLNFTTSTGNVFNRGTSTGTVAFKDWTFSPASTS